MTEKKEIEKRLIDHYGKGFKSPLSRELGVSLSTVKRWFNTDQTLSPVTVRAIESLLGERD